MNHRIAGGAALALALAIAPLKAEPLPELGVVTLTGPVLASKDVSAIERVGDFLLIGADDGVGKKGR